MTIEKKQAKKAIGERIKEIRESEGLTQKQFGELFQVDDYKIKHIESGRDDMLIEMPKKIKEEFKIAIEYLMYGEEPKCLKEKILKDLKEVYNLSEEQYNLILYVIKKK